MHSSAQRGLWANTAATTLSMAASSMQLQPSFIRPSTHRLLMHYLLTMLTPRFERGAQGGCR